MGLLTPGFSGVPEGALHRKRRGGIRLFLAAIALLAFLGAAYEALTWPDVRSLAAVNPRTSSFIERYRSRQPKASRSIPDPLPWVPYSRISPHLKCAVLVAEDINFFSHEGFDMAEIRKAIGEAMDNGESPRGASTITQQLAKNLWLSPSRNPLRKIKEAILARQLERELGKKRILEIYLNVVAFGPGTFGVETASRRFFGKSASDLDEGESAQLAASLPKPSLWYPGSRSTTYARRVERIRGRMDRAAFLWKLI